MFAKTEKKLMLDSKCEIVWTFELEQFLSTIKVIQPATRCTVIDHLVQQIPRQHTVRFQGHKAWDARRELSTSNSHKINVVHRLSVDTVRVEIDRRKFSRVAAYMECPVAVILASPCSFPKDAVAMECSARLECGRDDILRATLYNQLISW